MDMVEKEDTQGKVTARFIRRKEVINGCERMMEMLDIFTKSHYHALDDHLNGPDYLLCIAVWMEQKLSQCNMCFRNSQRSNESRKHPNQSSQSPIIPLINSCFSNHLALLQHLHLLTIAPHLFASQRDNNAIYSTSTLSPFLSYLPITPS